MSKSWLKGAKKAAAPLPRETEAIRAEYSDLCMKLGHANYQVTFNQTVVSTLLKRLEDLDREASERSKLDADKPAVSDSQGQPTSGAV
jgi:hypothetical protein